VTSISLHDVHWQVSTAGANRLTVLSWDVCKAISIHKMCAGNHRLVAGK